MRKPRRSSTHFIPALLLTGLVAGCAVPIPINLSTAFLRPTYERYGDPAAVGLRYDARRVTVAPGREVAIWHVKADEPRGIVVIAPASDRNKSLYVPAAEIFVPAGYDTILMDYEGFGESSGTLFDLDLAELSDNVLAVVDDALTHHPTVFVMGISTGGSGAVYAASQRDLAGLILEAPLVLELEAELWLRDQGVNQPILWEIANWWILPQIPPTFDILENIKHVEEPKLFLHSPGDTVVPFGAGVELFAAAPEPKEFIELTGGHVEMLDIDREWYTAMLVGWVDGVMAE